MKLNAFQRLLQSHAHKARNFEAITEGQFQEYMSNIEAYNEEEHTALEQELDAKWREAADLYLKRIDELAAERDMQAAERDKKWEEQNAAWAYKKNRRNSCPPALQFQLWELAKAACAIKAISNSDMRFIRREMRLADTAWLQELCSRVASAKDNKEQHLAEVKANTKKFRQRISCPPKNAFHLWEAVKQARQMRLISNAEVRAYREIRNYGDRDEVGNGAAALMAKIYNAKGVYILKMQLKQRQKARTIASRQRETSDKGSAQEEPGPAALAA